MRKRLLALSLLSMLVGGLLMGPVQAQDLTTRLTYFLNDLYSGALGSTLTFTTIRLGGTTSAFPALRRNATIGTRVDIIKADASAYGPLASAGFYNASTGNAILLLSDGAPTISSGFGTSPSIVSHNGSPTFRINVGTGGAATSGVVGLPTATTGWNCTVTDITNSTVTRQTADSTSTVTVTAAAAWAASDILLFHCLAF